MCAANRFSQPDFRTSTTEPVFGSSESSKTTAHVRVAHSPGASVVSATREPSKGSTVTRPVAGR